MYIIKYDKHLLAKTWFSDKLTKYQKCQNTVLLLTKIKEMKFKKYEKGKKG